MDKYAHKIFNLIPGQFEQVALEIFHFQRKNCPVYKKYLAALNTNPAAIKSIADIPFLPIDFFKTQRVTAGIFEEEICFTSSGTTGNETSKHFVKDLALYEKSFLKGFNHFYGQINDYCILALLPSYLEREGSSLIYMVNCFVEKSKHPQSGYFLHNHDELAKTIDDLEKKNQKTLLIGVSYALLDFTEKYRFNLKHTLVMETGGMKGRRKEMTRTELHEALKNSFGVNQIHSEYGMTELLSQAYSKNNGMYATPPWMRVLIRDAYDPFSLVENRKSGGINIIDLANLHSCAFVETMDIGKKYNNQSFEVLGRFDNTQIRGCNLIVA